MELLSCDIRLVAADPLIEIELIANRSGDFCGHIGCDIKACRAHNEENRTGFRKAKRKMILKQFDPIWIVRCQGKMIHDR